MASNSSGDIFHVTTWGESHGPAIGCVIDGVPPRLPLAEADIQTYLDKRRRGKTVSSPSARKPTGAFVRCV